MVGIVGWWYNLLVNRMEVTGLCLSRYVCFIVLIFYTLKSIPSSWGNGQHVALTFSHRYYVIAWALYFPELDH